MPSRFENLLLFFHDIDEDSYASSLNGKLLLTTEDEPLEKQVHGYVLNESLYSFGRYMRRHNQPLDRKFDFKQMFDAAAEGFDFSAERYITYLMRKNGKPNPFRVDIAVGEFEFHVCDSMEEAREVGKGLDGKPDIIPLWSELVIDRQTLSDLFNMRKVAWREADPEIVFNPSAYMRQKLAFPEFTP